MQSGLAHCPVSRTGKDGRVLACRPAGQLKTSSLLLAARHGRQVSTSGSAFRKFGRPTGPPAQQSRVAECRWIANSVASVRLDQSYSQSAEAVPESSEKIQ